MKHPVAFAAIAFIAFNGHLHAGGPPKIPAQPAAVVDAARQSRPGPPQEKPAFIPLLYAAEGAKSIQYYNDSGHVAWEYPAEMSRDVSLLPNGNILFTYNNNYNSSSHDNPSGVAEITPQGQTVFEFKTTGQVWSCCRLANGLTAIGAASQGRILFVDANGALVKSFPVKSKPGHACLRHVRATPCGNILVAEESAQAVREYTPEGVLMREIPVPFTPFSVQRLQNSNTLISGRTQIVEVDAQGQTVWHLKDTDIPGMGVRYLAGFQLFDNGDLLVCNAGGTVPLFRITREAVPRVVWTSGSLKLPFGHGVAFSPHPPLEGIVPPFARYPLDLPGGVREIVFCTRTASGDGHWYANFGYRSDDPKFFFSGRRGRLCKLDTRTRRVTALIEDLDGAVRDPVVSYDARRILFSWRKGGTDYFNLYECDTDGGNLRQITFGPWDDFECCYLPDGGIIFVSSRSKRWVNCMKSQVATLFRCDADGKNIRSLSGNIEQDNSPWVLPDGRIIYTRWEYVDRSQMAYHHLWTMFPDGTGQMVYFGNLNPSSLMIDAKPVPGTNDVVAAISGGHGFRDHLGRVCLINNENGPDDLSSIRALTPMGGYADPYPLSQNLFLAGFESKLLTMNRKGEMCTLFVHPDSAVMIQDPRPIVSRSREPVIPSRVDLEKTTGQLICQNVYLGRRMEGVQPGEIKKLLVLETLPKPVNMDGMTPPISFSSTFSLERILGTVPVEADGSANFEVPANRSISLVALDAQNRSVKRMQSFLSVMPGEVSSCVGCHENRNMAPASNSVRKLLAASRAPNKIEPIPGIPEIFDFTRDIQPILDRHCLSCHDARTRAGGVELTGDRSPMFSLSYYHLMSRMQVFVGGDLAKSNFPPRTLGDSISPLMWKLQGSSEDFQLADTFTLGLDKWPRLAKKEKTSHAQVRLSPEEIEKIRMWINSGGVYAGTYAALGSSSGIGWLNQNSLVNNIADIQSVKLAADVIARRCGGCHTDARALPVSPVDQLKTATYGQGYSGFQEADYLRPATRTYSRFRVFNLTHPENSLMLLAPLSKSAGGLGLCQQDTENPPELPGGAPSQLFGDTQNPDYQAILAAIRDTGKRLEENTLFYKPNFIPNREWLREMKRFGILPADLDPAKTPVDPYKTEQKYWESLWYKPGAKEQWGPEAGNPSAGREHCMKPSECRTVTK